jgi:hypothetical protein
LGERGKDLWKGRECIEVYCILGLISDVIVVGNGFKRWR